jgi:hypothetical protein
MDVLKLYPQVMASGRTIVNEKCSCGHFRSDHNNRFALGHGNCRRSDCKCNQFTWESFVEKR